MDSPSGDENGSNDTGECLTRCEIAFERCESSGTAYKDCNEIHTGCITGCDSSIVTSQ